MTSIYNPTHTKNLAVRVKPYLDKLKSREMTNREVADLLGANEQHLSRVLIDMGLKKDKVQTREDLKAATAAKKAYIAECAHTMTPEAAAKECGVSVRTILRYRDGK